MGRKPAGTWPPVGADGGAAVGLTAGAGALEVGAGLWLTGADGDDAAEAGAPTPAELTTGEVLTCAPPWWAFEHPASANDITTARVVSRRVDDDARGVMLLGRHSEPKGCVLHRMDRRVGSPRVGQVSLRTRRVRFCNRARLAQAIGDEGGDLTQVLHLLRGQRVEKVRTHAFDMARCRSREGSEARIGQHRQLPTTIGGTRLSTHPTVFFQPRDRVRQPATRRQRSVGELAHAHAPAGNFRQPNQDLVVRVRHGGVTGQFLIEALEQHVGGFDEGAPDALFGNREPASRLRRLVMWSSRLRRLVMWSSRLRRLVMWSSRRRRLDHM